MDGGVRPFASGTLPVRLSQRRGDDSPLPFFSPPYGEKAPFRLLFRAGREGRMVPAATPFSARSGKGPRLPATESRFREKRSAARFPQRDGEGPPRLSCGGTVPYPFRGLSGRCGPSPAGGPRVWSRTPFPNRGTSSSPQKRRPGNAVTSSQPFKKRRFSGPRGSRAPRTAVRTQRAVSPGPRERRVPFPSPFGNLPGRRPEAHRRPHAGTPRSSGPARATSARPPGNLPARRAGSLRGRRGGGGFRRLRRRAGAFFGSPRRYLVFNSTRPLSRSISASLRLARRMYWRTGRRAMQT